MPPLSTAIRSIAISQFRSLRSVVVNPGSFTVLVGPNNSGKTNIVDAIDFLGDVHRYGLETAMSRKGGYEGIASRGQKRTLAPIRLEATVLIAASEISLSARLRPPKPLRPTSQFRVTHRFQLRSARALESDYRVDAEQFEIWAPPELEIDRPLVAYSRLGNSFEVSSTYALEGRYWKEALFPFADPAERIRIEQRPVTDDDLMLTGRTYYLGPLFWRLSRELADIRVVQGYPGVARATGVSTPSPELGRQGENLPGYIRFLRKNKSAWAAVIEGMRRVVPGLEDIRPAFTADRRLTLRFVESSPVRTWSSDEVSDGTIHALVILAALNDPRTSCLLIEEPENHLHPWIIRELVRALRAAGDKQVIATTHSPTVIDCLRPEEVAIVSREHGETRVRDLAELAPESLGLWAEGHARLSEMFDAGLIPAAVPLE